MTIGIKVVVIDDVRKHPDADRLTIVSTEGHEVVANLQDDGTPRWKTGEVAIYVPENAIIPEDVLKERGYWDEAKGKGFLGGSKGNRVKMQRFVGFESRGLLFKVEVVADGQGYHYVIRRGDAWQLFLTLDDTPSSERLASLFGLTEFIPE